MKQWCINLAGEIFELKAELNSDKKDRKKEAVKKVIASMTVGKDVRYCIKIIIIFWFESLVKSQYSWPFLHEFCFEFQLCLCLSWVLNFKFLNNYSVIPDPIHYFSFHFIQMVWLKFNVLNGSV